MYTYIYIYIYISNNSHISTTSSTNGIVIGCPAPEQRAKGTPTPNNKLMN